MGRRAFVDGAHARGIRPPMSIFSSMPQQAQLLSALGEGGRAAIVDLLVLMLFAEGDAESHVDAFVVLLSDIPGIAQLTNEQRGELITQSLTKLREMPTTGLASEISKMAVPLSSAVRPTVVALAGVVACFGGKPSSAHTALLDMYVNTLGVDPDEVDRTMGALSFS